MRHFRRTVTYVSLVPGTRPLKSGWIEDAGRVLAAALLIATAAWGGGWIAAMAAVPQSASHASKQEPQIGSANPAKVTREAAALRCPVIACQQFVIHASGDAK
jgi:hypothetical protein